MPSSLVRRILPSLIGLGAFLWLATILPRTSAELFASPDETAVLAFARAWTPADGFRLPTNLPATLVGQASLHPRSMVRQGAALVPVGFLGLPFLVMLIERLTRGLGVYLTPLLVLSAVYPLRRLVKRYATERVATLTLSFTLSFPTVLLYANRGLFPNLPVVALALWSVWAMGEAVGGNRTSGRQVVGGAEHQVRVLTTRQPALSLPKGPDVLFVRLFAAIAGLTLGLALVIRPIEALWLIPWVAWGAFSVPRRTGAWKTWFAVAAVAFAVSLGGAALARETYGTQNGWLPAVGYQLRDASDLSNRPQTADPFGSAQGRLRPQTADRRPLTADRSPFVLPFGFHPRVMWENLRIYVFNYLSLWTAAALIGACLALMYGRPRPASGAGSPSQDEKSPSQDEKWTREKIFFLLLCAWTVATLLLLYGQALYADNIRGNFTLGNSFLRYLVPLAPLMAYGLARLIDALWQVTFRGRALAVTLTAFFVLYGAAVAWNGDEEGIRNTQRELRRYQAIRAAAEQRLQPGTVILSERSDKIFASGPFVAVSPLPDKPTLRALLESGAPVALFHRRLTDEQAQALIGGAAVNSLIPVFELDNEALYLLLGVN